MGTQPDELSTTPADIEATRADLSRNIDDLTAKVSPQRVMERQKLAAKGRLSSIKDKVMGTASTAGSGVDATGGNLSEGASSVVGSTTDGAQAAVSSLQSRTEGNPLAAGLIAFGAGMLISALLPASRSEAKAANRVVETAKDTGLVDQGASMGQEVGQNLREAAVQAAQEVQKTAQDSAQTLKDEGQSSTQQVKERAKPS